jgi:hypothetical protein
MRTTRSKKNGTTVHPYERPLDRGRWIRETSFTGWEGMNNAAIVRVTETLDKVGENLLLLHNRELI